MYEIDRKMASRLLKTSIRTVDRYIAANKLSIEKRDGRIWLNKKEIIDLKNSKRVDIEKKKKIEMSIVKNGNYAVDMSIDGVDNLSTNEFEGQYSQHEKSPSKKNTNEGKSIYQKLFEEAKDDLKHKQELLEGANYRVGQLEATLKETVPLLDHQRALTQEHERQQQLIQGFREKEVQTNQLEKRLKEEKIDKKLYLVLLFIILLLQPLWLFLAYR